MEENQREMHSKGLIELSTMFNGSTLRLTASCLLKSRFHECASFRCMAHRSKRGTASFMSVGG
jgi:hypothetical protein